jgi:UDP-glucose 4-epimerase
VIRLPSELAAPLRAHYDTRRVCVTGGAGFIGGHLVDALMSLGASITVIDDLSNSALGHLGELIELDPARVRFVHGSILDPAALARAAEGAAAVFHLGAVCSVPLSLEQPMRTWEVNATGTLRVLEAARAQGSKRVVFSASSSAYGNAATLPIAEDTLPAPLSPYAASKVAGERLMEAYAESFGLSTVSLRYFNIFGPRQLANSPYSGVIPRFVDAAIAGEPLLMHGDGEQSRDFTYVGNAVLANLLAGATTTPLAGEVINIGTGEHTTVRELASRVLESFGRPASLAENAPPRRGDVLHSLADISRARELLGYEPLTTVEDGLDQTFRWWREHAGAAEKRA